MRPIYPNTSPEVDAKTGFNNLRIFWCTKDYDDDHIIILLQREVHRMQFLNQSPQISERGRLVDWMKTIAAKKNLDQFSIHLAVYLLDIFMDNYNIIAEKLHLISLVCLLLATKFEERDCNILKTNELNDLVDNKYTISDYYGLEILILKLLKWNLLLPSAVHFVHIYIEFVFIEDDFEGLTLKTETDIWNEARFIIKYYLDLVMEDIHLMHEKPSKVASAIMALTRAKFNFSIIWPQKLFSISGYALFELKSIMLRFRQLTNK